MPDQKQGKDRKAHLQSNKEFKSLINKQRQIYEPEKVKQETSTQ